jgi:hypothetical protein
VPITSEPPPNPLPNGGGFVRFEGHWETQRWASVMGLRYTGTPTGTDLNDVAHDLFTAYEDNLLDWQSDDSAITKTTAVGTFGGDILEGLHIGSEHGTASDTNDTLQNCVLLSWHIASHYRGGKPRTYLPGLTESKRDDARSLDDTFVSDLTALAQSFLAAVNIIGEGGITAIELGVWARFRSGAALSPPVFHPYLDVSVQKRVCTQRRRLGSEF